MAAWTEVPGYNHESEGAVQTRAGIIVSDWAMAATSRLSLGEFALFAGLEPDELAAVSRRCQTRSYQRAQQIIVHGDRTNDVYFVLEGSVRAVIYSQSGREVAFRDLGAGSMFGELSAIDGQPRSVYVVALAPTEVACLSRPEFLSIVEENPSVALATLEHLTALVRILSDRVFEYTTLDVNQRIRAELIRLARQQPMDSQQARIEAVPTHAELAAMLSTHREAVTRHLRELVNRGLIRREKRVLVIPDLNALVVYDH